MLHQLRLLGCVDELQVGDEGLGELSVRLGGGLEALVHVLGDSKIGLVTHGGLLFWTSFLFRDLGEAAAFLRLPGARPRTIACSTKCASISVACSLLTVPSSTRSASPHDAELSIHTSGRSSRFGESRLAPRVGKPESEDLLPHHGDRLARLGLVWNEVARNRPEGAALGRRHLEEDPVGLADRRRHVAGARLQHLRGGPVGLLEEMLDGGEKKPGPVLEVIVDELAADTRLRRQPLHRQGTPAASADDLGGDVEQGPAPLVRRHVRPLLSGFGFRHGLEGLPDERIPSINSTFCIVFVFLEER